MTKEQTFASVWDAIEDTPAEAENMKVRSTLLKLNQYLERPSADKVDEAFSPKLPLPPSSRAA